MAWPRLVTKFYINFEVVLLSGVHLSIIRVTKLSSVQLFSMVQITPLYGVKTAVRGVLWNETAQMSFLPRYFSYSRLSTFFIFSGTNYQPTRLRLIETFNNSRHIQLRRKYHTTLFMYTPFIYKMIHCQ
jgi:hypothetical protein